MTRAALLLVTLSFLGGCRHWHRPHNAPGIVDVRTPPREIGVEQVEIPGDPGERMVAINPGISMMSGFRTREGGGGGLLDLGAEVSLLRGESERSHNDGDRGRLFLPPGFQLPDRGVGLTLGWSAFRLVEVESDDPDTEEVDESREIATTGPVHLRGYLFKNWFGAGAGWTLDPVTGDHGPELVGYAGVVTARTSYTRDDHFEFVLGYQMKFPLTLVESR